MGYEFLKDIVLNELETVSIHVDEERKLVRLTLFKDYHYQDEFVIDLKDIFADEDE